MKDPLPVPDQLERQLSKCKTVRDADTYCVSRTKTAEEIAAALEGGKTIIKPQTTTSSSAAKQ